MLFLLFQCKEVKEVFETRNTVERGEIEKVEVNTLSEDEELANVEAWKEQMYNDYSKWYPILVKPIILSIGRLFPSNIQNQVCWKVISNALTCLPNSTYYNVADRLETSKPLKKTVARIKGISIINGDLLESIDEYSEINLPNGAKFLKKLTKSLTVFERGSKVYNHVYSKWRIDPFCPILIGSENINATYPFSEYKGDVNLTTQEEVDAFRKLKYTSIRGSLTIGKGTSHPKLSNIKNLSVLSSLISVKGNLKIYGNPSLTSLSGLDNIIYVGGSLNIIENDALISLRGLDKITYIGGSLNITENIALTSLNGLDNFISVGGSLNYIYNNALTSLSGLNNITSVGGSLNIIENNALITLSGLDNITSIGESLYIRNNDALTSLSGLE